jgi:hypothetical protein
MTDQETLTEILEIYACTEAEFLTLAFQELSNYTLAKQSRHFVMEIVIGSKEYMFCSTKLEEVLALALWAKGPQ